MKKELFIEAINALEKQAKHDIEFANALNIAFPNAFEANLLPDNHYIGNILLKLLQDIMSDTEPDPYGQSWIEYFCFELDFGANYKAGMVKDESGNDIPLSNAEELYDFLIDSRLEKLDNKINSF